MSTKYNSIVANPPTYASAGEKGARNVDSLSTIFPKFNSSNPVLSKVGTKEGADVPVNLADGETYKSWYYDNVVNGKVDSGWFSDVKGSTISMNFDGADGPPNLSIEGPLLDKDKKKVATNSFVPFGATLDITQQSPKNGEIPFTDGSNNDAFYESIKKKAIGTPGSGENATTSARNPAETSKKQVSPYMSLGEYLPAKK